MSYDYPDYERASDFREALLKKLDNIFNALDSIAQNTSEDNKFWNDLYQKIEDKKIEIYCIDCKQYFKLNETKSTIDGIWVLCPICHGQNYTIKIIK